jgi:hypothetical protein
MGGGRSSSSNTTQTFDNRIANERGVALSGVSLESSMGGGDVSINIESMDADIAGKALDASMLLSAIGGDGFARLLGTAERLFSASNAQAANAMDVSAGSQQAVRDAYESAATLRAGSVDQRTLIIAAVVGVAGLVALSRKG